MATATGYARTDQPRIEGTRFFGEVMQRTHWRGAVFSKLFHPRARNVPSHEHEHSYFSLLLRGEYAEAGAIIAPMTVTFLPMGIRHDGQVGPRGAGFFTVEVAESCLGEDSRALSCVFQERGPMLWAALRLFTDFSENGIADHLLLDEMMAELVACAARKKIEQERTVPRWLKQISDLLADRYVEPLSLSELAAEADVHPVHLERTFRRFVGCTMGRRIHQLRVRQACELLSDSDRPLVEIAMATGFADQPHFTRVFRRLAGTTPARFRAQLLRLRRKSA